MPDPAQTPPVNAMPPYAVPNHSILGGGVRNAWPFHISSGTAFSVYAEKRYTGNRVTTTTTNLLSFRAMANGTIKALNLWMPTNTGATSAIFNLRINSVAQFTGASRLIVASSQSSAAKTGLSTAVTLGDLIELSVEQVPSVGIGTPVEFLMKVEVS